MMDNDMSKVVKMSDYVKKNSNGPLPFIPEGLDDKQEDQYIHEIATDFVNEILLILRDSYGYNMNENPDAVPHLLFVRDVIESFLRHMMSKNHFVQDLVEYRFEDLTKEQKFAIGQQITEILSEYDE